MEPAFHKINRFLPHKQQNLYLLRMRAVHQAKGHFLAGDAQLSNVGWSQVIHVSLLKPNHVVWDAILKAAFTTYNR